MLLITLGIHLSLDACGTWDKPAAAMQARVQPTSSGELIEYLLSTEQPEMEYETARCRPLLTQEFLAFLQQEVGQYTCPDEVDAACMPAVCTSDRSGDGG